MSNPLPPHLAKASEREAWVEAQAWRRCVESRRRRDRGRDTAEEQMGSQVVARSRTNGSRRDGSPKDRSHSPADLGGLSGLAYRLELGTSDYDALERGLGALRPEQRSAEIERLLGLAGQVELLAGLTPRLAPLALDASVEERAAHFADAVILADVVTPAPRAATPLPERAGVSDGKEEDLHNWMAVLNRVSAPTALDQFVEREIQALADSTPSQTRELANAKHGVGQGGESLRPEGASRTTGPRQWSVVSSAEPPNSPERTSPPQLVRDPSFKARLKRATLVAAAIVCVAGLGLLIRSMTKAGAGSDYAAGSVGEVGRFSFRYIEVDLGSEQDAERPVLRLLRGWASHIRPSAIEKPDAKK